MNSQFRYGLVCSETILLITKNYICVCIKSPLVVRYETEISAVKVNWSILVGFREISQSGSILHKETVDSYFNHTSKLESSRNQNFSEQIKESTCQRYPLSDLKLEILKRVMHQIYTSTGYFNIINQIMNCLFNEIYNYNMVFFWDWKNIS